MSGSAQSGYLCLFASTVCNGVSYHLAKAAADATSSLTMVSLAAFCVAGAFLACGWAARALGGGGLVGQVTPAALGRMGRDEWPRLAAAAALGATGGWLLVHTNQRFGPETAAFLGNLTFVFMVLAGAAMGERLRLAETATVALILAGAFLFSCRGGAIQWQAMGIMGLACAFTASKQLVAQRLTARANPFTAVAAMNVVMGLWALGLGMFQGALVFPTWRAFGLIAAAGLSGSMVGMSLLYIGYNRVGVARGAPVDAMRPLMVLLVGLLLGKALPTPVQIAGGVMVLAGSALLKRLAPRTRAAGARPEGS